MPQSKFKLPEELKGVTKDTLDRIEERVDKCYSKDKYQEFEESVEKITLKTIGTDGGRETVKKYAKEATKDYLEEQGWKNKTFWIPVGISVIAIIVAVLTIIFK